MDRLNDALDGDIALLDQPRVQSHLRAVGVAAVVLAVVEGAEGIAIAAAMLVVALVGGDEGKSRKIAAGEIGVKAARAIEAHNVLQAVVSVIAVLHASEIGEGVVLDGVELHHARST